MILEDVQESIRQALIDNPHHATEIAQWIVDNPDAIVELAREHGKSGDGLSTKSFASQLIEKGFDPNEARDDSGKWTSGSGGTGKPAKEEDGAESVWQDQGIHPSDAYRAKVLPAIQALFSKYADRLKLDKEYVLEGLENASAEEVLDSLIGDNPNSNADPVDAFKGGQILFDRINNLAERGVSKLSEDDQTDWEDATSSWFRESIRRELEKRQRELVAILKR